MRALTLRRPAALLATLVLPGCSDPAAPALSQLEIRLTPSAASLMVNDTVRARLLGLDQSGNPYPAGPVTWTSSDPSVLAVDAEGLVEGRGAGSANLVATVGRLSESATISVAGTRHTETITQNETWSLAGSPHRVDGRLAVGGAGGATVTIEAGVTVVFAAGAGMTFGIGGVGALIASGSGAAPILMVSADAPPAPGVWIGLTFRGRTRSELRHVRLSGCGGPRNDEQPAACVVMGHRFFGLDPTVLVQDVAVEDAAGAALILQGESQFATGSSGLSVRDVAGPVAILPAATAADFPLGGAFADNQVNEIHVTGDTIGSSVTWGQAGLPWTVVGQVLIEGKHAPVLTISPGVVLRLAGPGGFVVGKNAPGGLHIGAVGAAPVSLGPADQYGWSGIIFWPAALPSSIAETTLDQCVNYDEPHAHGCVVLVGNFFGTAPTPVFANVTIRRSSWAGVGITGGARFGDGSHDVVITETVGSLGVPVYIYESPASSLPAGRYTGNATDVIWVSRPVISGNQTWHDRGVPYWLDGMAIEHAASPVVTLEPGVVLQIGGGIRIGGFAPGGLRAVGTAETPVVLRGQQGTAAGTWGGIEIGQHANASTEFDHVILESAGADWRLVATSVLIARDLGEIIRNTLIRLSGSCAITRQSGETWATDFTAPHLANRFEDNLGPAQCGP